MIVMEYFMIIISNKIEIKINIDAIQIEYQIYQNHFHFMLSIFIVCFKKDNLQIKPRIIFNVQPSLK